MSEQEIESQMVALMRQGLVAPNDRGEAQAKVIIEFRALLKEWQDWSGTPFYDDNIALVRMADLQNRTREALK